MSIFHPAEDKFTQMTQTPIPNLVATLAVPTIISMLVTSVYNMADTYFVGQIGTSATAAVGVALPLMAVIQAIGFTFGQGSGNTVSRLLGQQKREEAESMISVAFFSAFLCGLVLGVLGTVLIEPMVHFLGATDTSAPYTIDYVHFILIGAPFMVSSLVLNNQFRFQGNAVFGMVGIFSGAIVNIVLDPIFIFALDLGTGGAALATILSQFLSFCLLVGAAMYGGLLAYCLMMAEINALLFVVWNSIAAGLVIMSVQMQWGLVAESIDYNEYLTGKRNEGTIYGFFSLSRRIGSTITGSLTVLLIAAIGYNPELTKAGLAQAAGTITGIKLMVIGFPLLAAVLSFFSFTFIWNINKDVRDKMTAWKLGKTAK